MPKKARDSWSHLFSRVIQDIVSSPSDLDHWYKLFMLPRCILRCPTPGARSSTLQVVRSIKEKCRKWLEGGFISLWQEAVCEGTSHVSRKKPSVQSTRSSNAKRAKRAAQVGRFSKAVQALGSLGLAPCSESTKNELLSKHPQAALPSLPPPSTSPLPSISMGVVMKAIKFFPVDTAPGPSGLRATHLKESVLCPTPSHAQSALTSITSFVSLLCSGDIPSEIVPFFCGASLLGSLKKDGGVRPIAVGDVLRRLVSKCLSSVVVPSVLDVLPPHQVGVGVQAGAEAVVHSLNLVRSLPDIPDSSKWVLLLDFKNAFYSIDRTVMFKEIRERLPDISPWMECCYGVHPLLFYGDYTNHSCCGVQQGDPLGPFGFSLALQPIVDRISLEVPNLVMNSW